MITLSVIEIAVKNFEQQLKFYRDLLGLKVFHLEEKDSFVMFDTGSSKLALSGHTPTSGKGNITLFFETKDIETAYVQLQKKGIRFSSKIIPVHWGKKACFADAEGNEHYLYQEKIYQE